MGNGLHNNTTRLSLDCKGLNCPLPIVNLGRKLKLMNVGEEIEVEADDPAFKEDVIAFVRHLHYKLVSLKEENGITKAIIEKQ